jgi:hypothetical protein
LNWVEPDPNGAGSKQALLVRLRSLLHLTNIYPSTFLVV